MDVCRPPQWPKTLGNHMLLAGAPEMLIPGETGRNSGGEEQR